MKQSTLQALQQAYIQLDSIADQLYAASDDAVEKEDFVDASLLVSVADKIYEEAENLDVLLSEVEEP